MEEVWDTQQWAVAYEGFCGDTARGMGKDVDCGGQQISDATQTRIELSWDGETITINKWATVGTFTAINDPETVEN